MYGHHASRSLGASPAARAVPTPPLVTIGRRASHSRDSATTRRARPPGTVTSYSPDRKRGRFRNDRICREAQRHRIDASAIQRTQRARRPPSPGARPCARPRAHRHASMHWPGRRRAGRRHQPPSSRRCPPTPRRTHRRSRRHETASARTRSPQPRRSRRGCSVPAISTRSSRNVRGRRAVNAVHAPARRRPDRDRRQRIPRQAPRRPRKAATRAHARRTTRRRRPPPVAGTRSASAPLVMRPRRAQQRGVAVDDGDGSVGKRSTHVGFGHGRESRLLAPDARRHPVERPDGDRQRPAQHFERKARVLVGCGAHEYAPWRGDDVQGGRTASRSARRRRPPTTTTPRTTRCSSPSTGMRTLTRRSRSPNAGSASNESLASGVRSTESET